MKRRALAALVILAGVLLFSLFILQTSLAGTQHGVNGLVNNATDGTNANGADVTFTISRINCVLNDTVGVTGNSKTANWYAIDMGNCQGQWLEGDNVSIYIFKDEKHTAETSVELSEAGNDQAPTVNLSSAQFCGDGNCTSFADGGNETCLSCPLDCKTKCVVNGICEICDPHNTTSFCSLDKQNQSKHGACENLTNCPSDCICNPPDGKCDKPYENYTNCPWDCHCGNFVCEWWDPFNETAETCPEDCTCGNLVCDNNETCETCPIDCQNCLCGNGICEPEANETQLTCPIDCATACNNDGVCDFGEFYATCPDCPLYCGNMICDTDKGENDGTCPSDCPPTVCGDQVCETQNGETWENCPIDCYVGKCGDKQCLLAENQKNCCTDCGCPKGIGFWKIYIKENVCDKNNCREKWNWYWALVLVAIIVVIVVIVKKTRKKKPGKEKKEKKGKAEEKKTKKKVTTEELIAREITSVERGKKVKE